jgi:hypothetical protein
MRSLSKAICDPLGDQSEKTEDLPPSENVSRCSALPSGPALKISKAPRSGPSLSGMNRQKLILPFVPGNVAPAGVATAAAATAAIASLLRRL